MALGRTNFGGRRSVDPGALRRGKERLSPFGNQERLTPGGRAYLIQRNFERFCADKAINAQQISVLVPKYMDPTGWLKTILPDADKVKQMGIGTSLTESIKLVVEYKAHWSWLKQIFSSIELSQHPDPSASFWDVYTAAVSQRYSAFENIHRNESPVVHDPQILKEYALHGPWLLLQYRIASLEEAKLSAKPEKRVTTRERFERLISDKSGAFQKIQDLGIQYSRDPE